LHNNYTPIGGARPDISSRRSRQIKFRLS
jgi:hypothetical protein